MSDNGMNELDARERDALRALSGRGAYSRKLEDRIAQTLKHEGLITPSPSIWGRAAKAGGMVAALAIAFVLGSQYGNRDAGPSDQPAEPVASPGSEIPGIDSAPSGDFLYTAYHMDLDDPLESGATESGQDRNSVFVKNLDY